MTITHKDAVRWGAVWPVEWKRGTHQGDWRAEWMTASAAGKAFRSYWDRERTVAWVSQNLGRREYRDRYHHILFLQARKMHTHRPVVFVQNGVVIDGNHTLIALLRGKLGHRQVLVFERAN
jgi:hypothetical protein